jgi:hypothetical protein
MHRILPVFGLALLAGCSLLAVEAEVPEVCLTYPDLAVEGVGGAASVMRSYTLEDLDAIHELTALDADLVFTRAEVRAHGIADLSFVTSALLTIADPTETLPTLVVYACDGDCGADGPVLGIPAGSDRDALDYVAGDAVDVGIAVTGPMPEGDWSMDVDVCVAGNLSYSVEL